MAPARRNPRITKSSSSVFAPDHLRQVVPFFRPIQIGAFDGVRVARAPRFITLGIVDAADDLCGCMAWIVRTSAIADAKFRRLRSLISDSD
jgi:hypothetical protein